MNEHPLFFDYVEQRAYRLAFWALLESEQPEELPDKVCYHQKLKDENYVREYPRRPEADPAKAANGQNDDGGRRSSVERVIGAAEQPGDNGRPDSEG